MSTTASDKPSEPRSPQFQTVFLGALVFLGACAAALGVTLVVRPEGDRHQQAARVATPGLDLSGAPLADVLASGQARLTVVRQDNRDQVAWVVADAAGLLAMTKSQPASDRDWSLDAVFKAEIPSGITLPKNTELVLQLDSTLAQEWGRVGGGARLASRDGKLRIEDKGSRAGVSGVR